MKGVYRINFSESCGTTARVLLLCMLCRPLLKF